MPPPTPHPPRPRARRRWAQQAAKDRGSVTPFVLILVPGMVAAIGLTFDGAQILAARRQAFDNAQNAAIAGTQGISETATRTGDRRLDPTQVAIDVDNYLTTVGATGTHTSTADTVTVTVTESVDLELLSILGIDTKTVEGTATARVVRGVEGPDT